MNLNAGGFVIEIKVLGTGCPKCRKLFDAASQAVQNSGVEAQLSKVDDITEILNYGVMMTPALVVDGTVRSVGKVLTSDQIQALFTEGGNR